MCQTSCHKVSSHMPPKVNEFSHRSRIVNKCDMWQDCYHTGLYPICRSNTELTAAHGKQITLSGGSWSCTVTEILLENEEEVKQKVLKQDRWREKAYGINLEEDQAGDWAQNAVAQQHSHQTSTGWRCHQLLWGQTFQSSVFFSKSVFIYSTFSVYILNTHFNLDLFILLCP